MNPLGDYSDNLLIHIGYPKTGSTWLQDHIFNSGDFGFCIPWENSRAMAITEFVIQGSYKFKSEDVYRKYQNGLRSAYRRNLIPVLSDETLGGDPLRWFINSRHVADRLKATFPNARILICIREQRRAIYSLYSEYIKQSGLEDVRTFIGDYDIPLGRAPICDMDQFEYDLLIDYYQKNFGCDRVLVLPYELFSSNKRLFLGTLLRFLGIEKNINDLNIPSSISNPSLGAAAMHIRRHLNRYSAKPDYTSSKQKVSFKINRKLTNLIDKIIPDFYNIYYKEQMYTLINDYIGTRYSKSNDRVETLTGLSLGNFGYAVSPDVES